MSLKVFVEMKAALSVIQRGVRTQAVSQKWPLKNQSARCISASQLTVDTVSDDKRFNNRPVKEDLTFGETLSDHMLTVEWEVETDWSAPKIVPYQDLSISPAASCLHYGKD